MRDLAEAETGVVEVDEGLAGGLDDGGRQGSWTSSKVGDFLPGGHFVGSVLGCEGGYREYRKKRKREGSGERKRVTGGPLPQVDQSIVGVIAFSQVSSTSNEMVRSSSTPTRLFSEMSFQRPMDCAGTNSGGYGGVHESKCARGTSRSDKIRRCRC